MSDNFEVGSVEIAAILNLERLNAGLVEAVSSVNDAGLKMAQALVKSVESGLTNFGGKQQLSQALGMGIADIDKALTGKLSLTVEQAQKLNQYVQEGVRVRQLEAEAAARLVEQQKLQIANAERLAQEEKKTAEFIEKATNAGSRTQLSVSRGDMEARIAEERRVQEFISKATNTGTRTQLSVDRTDAQARIAEEERIQGFISKATEAGTRTQLNVARSANEERIAEEKRTQDFIARATDDGTRLQLALDKKAHEERIRAERDAASAIFTERQRLAAGLLEAGRGMQQAGMLLSIGVTAPIVALGTAALKSSANIEVAQMSLTRMLGSANAAGILMEDIKKFTLSTPFEFKGSLESFRRLSELGFAAKDAIKVLTVLGNTVAATGGDTNNLNRVVLAFGKIREEGRLTARDLTNLSRDLIPAVQMLAEGKGVSQADIFDMVRKRAISSTEAIDLMLKGLTKRYEGEMAVRSQTLQGLFQNTQDKITLVLAQVGDVFKPLAKDFLQWTFDALDKVSALAKAFSELPKPVQMTALGFLGLAAASGPVLLVFGRTLEVAGHLLLGFNKLFYAFGSSGLAGATTVLTGAFNVLAPVLTTVAALFIGWEILDLVKSLVKLSETAGDLFKSLDPFTGLNKSLKESFSSLWALLKSLPPVQLLINITPKWVSSISDTVNKGIDAAKQNFRDNGGFRAIVDPVFAARTTSDQLTNFLNPQASLNLHPAAGHIETDKRFAPEVTPDGRGITNATKALIDDQTSKAVDAMNSMKAKAEDAAKEIRKAFSTLGIEDFKLEIDDMMKAFARLGGVLTQHQKFDAIENIIEKLSEAKDKGVLTEAQFAKTASGLAKSMPGYIQFAMTQGNAADAAEKLDKELQRLDEQSDTWGKRLKSMGIVQFTSEIADMTMAFMHSSFGIADNALQLDSLSKAENKAGTAAQLLTTTISKGMSSDLQSLKGLWESLGVKSSTADIQTMHDNLLKLQGLYGNEPAFARDLLHAWDNYYKARIESGQKLSYEEQRSFERIEKQLGSVNRMQQAWKRFGSEVSTIFTDLGKEVLDIFLPLNQTAAKTDGLSSSIKSTFNDAFNGLVARGYSDPVKAMNDIVAAIKNAGSLAEANTIAIKNFGDAAGPQLAKALRDGTLSVADLNVLMKGATDQIHEHADEVTKIDKLHQLWTVTLRALGRALVQEVAKTLSDVVMPHLKDFAHWIEMMLTKLPVLGGVFAKVFGVGGSVASSIHIPSIPFGGGSVTDPISVISDAEKNLGGVAEGVGTGASTASSAGGAVASGIAGTVNMISGIVGAVGSVATAVITGMTAFHANTLLGRIEENTRAIKIDTTEGADSIYNKTKESYQQLLNVVDRLVDIRAALIDSVMTSLDGIGNTLAVNIYQVLLGIADALKVPTAAFAAPPAFALAGATPLPVSAESAQAVPQEVYARMNTVSSQAPTSGDVTININGTDSRAFSFDSDDTATLAEINRLARGIKRRGVGRGSRTSA
jgi:tape measure domain-containing protein